MLNEMKLYGVIGDTITGPSVKAMLDTMDQQQPLYVRIDSEGGSVFDGLSIYEAFAAYPGPKKAIIEPTAFSIASYIAAAFDEVEIVENGYVMIHSPWTEAVGNAAEMTKQAELLAKLETSMVDAYSKKTGMSAEQVKGLMAKETFLNATEAVRLGFASRVVSTEMKSRLAPQSRHNKLPQMVFAALFGAGPSGDKTEPTKEIPMSTEPVAATIEEIEAKFPNMKPERILACVKKKLPMASVMTEALSAMEEEMMALRAKLAEYETKAKAMEEMKPEEEPEPEMKAQAKSGVKPVAKATSSSKPSAKLQWESLLSAKISAGLPRAKAIKAIDLESPGLREQMVEEINIARKGAE